MGDVYTDLLDFMKRPAVVETLIDLLLCTVPIWVAVMIGLVIGWSWRPRWTGLVYLGLRSRFRFLWTAPPGFGARRLWFAFTALSAFSVLRKLWGNFRRKESTVGASRGEVGEEGRIRNSASLQNLAASLSATPEGEDVVTEKDLEHLLHLLDGKGDIAWQNQMERTTPNMIYHAWRLDPEVGPVVYRSKTIFEDATPELVRDFFWDDEFRCKWDNMLAYYKILEEFPQNGTMIVHWIKKFPFFCSDREYIIGRRIWESGKAYYCVTKIRSMLQITYLSDNMEAYRADQEKLIRTSDPEYSDIILLCSCSLSGMPYLSIPKNEKPRRVEHYFSSWRIRAVESRKQDGQMTACEVSLIHYEDMGIPKDVAKMGVRHGMWGTVKKLHSGMRAYQLMRKTNETNLSRCAMMARITTKVSVDSTDSLDSESISEELGQETSDVITPKNTRHGIDWKWVVIGGVAIACGFQSGIVGKAVLFGAARRLARR